MIEKSKFKNSKGNYLTRSLFFETTLADKDQVLYTLKDQEHKGYPSLYFLYMGEEDLTEYDFANKYLDGWKHWTLLTESDWFKPYVKRWRQELRLLIAARCLKTIQRTAQDREDKSSMQANRYLLDGGWEKISDPVGRPSKKAIEKKAKELVMSEEEIAEDYERLGLTTTH